MFFFFTRVWITASILISLYNAVVWMVSSRIPISNTFNPISKLLVTVLVRQLQLVSPLSAPVTIGITVNLIFFSVFRQGPSTCLSFRFLWFSLCGPLWRQSSLDDWFSFSFFLLSLGLVFWSWLADLFISQNPREFYASHSLGRILVCAYKKK